MIVLTVEGVPPWDGSYEFADFAFTNRELHKIRQISGCRAGELIEALDVNDAAAMVGVAVVILARFDKAVDADDLWDSTVGSLRLEIVADGDDAGPPTTADSGSVTPSDDAGGGDDFVAAGV